MSMNCLPHVQRALRVGVMGDDRISDRQWCFSSRVPQALGVALTHQQRFVIVLVVLVGIALLGVTLVIEGYAKEVVGLSAFVLGSSPILLIPWIVMRLRR